MTKFNKLEINKMIKYLKNLQNQKINNTKIYKLVANKKVY